MKRGEDSLFEGPEAGWRGACETSMWMVLEAQERSPGWTCRSAGGWCTGGTKTRQSVERDGSSTVT